MTNFSVYTKEISPGRWLAATGQAPYFCFEGETREGVIEVSKRALRFYEGVSDQLQSQVKITRARERAIVTFRSTDKVPAKELAVA